MDKAVEEVLRTARRLPRGITAEEAEYLWAEIEHLRLVVAALRATAIDIDAADAELEASGMTIERSLDEEGRRVTKYVRREK